MKNFQSHKTFGSIGRKLDSWELVLRNSYGHSFKTREQCRSKVAKKAVVGPAPSTQPVEEKPEARQLYGNAVSPPTANLIELTVKVGQGLSK